MFKMNDLDRVFCAYNPETNCNEPPKLFKEVNSNEENPKQLQFQRDRKNPVQSRR